MRRWAILAASAGLIAACPAPAAEAALILQYFQGPAAPNRPFQTFYSQFGPGGQPSRTKFSSTPIQVRIDMPAAAISNVIAFMRFVDTESVGPVTNLGGGLVTQQFVGMVQFNSLVTFTGVNYLTATFNNPNGGNPDPDDDTSSPARYFAGSPTTSALQASSQALPDTLVFTSDVLGGPFTTIQRGTEDMQLGFSDLVPPSGSAGTTTRAFVANGTGNFNAEFAVIVPEPGTVAGAMLAGVIAVGLIRRRRASVA